MAHKYPAVAGNYTKGRTAKISEVVIHHMAGVMTAEQCGRIFQTSGRKASAHYGVGNDGSVGRYVDEANTAWSNGNAAANARSVNIEVSNSSAGGDWLVSDIAFEKLIELVADIANRNNLGKLVVGQNLRKHKDYIATACPGPYLTSRMEEIAERANALIGGEPTPTPTPPAPPTGFLPARGYWKFGDKDQRIEKMNAFLRKTFPAYAPTSVLGNYFGPVTLNTVKEFQKRAKSAGKYNDVIDGNVGPLTLKALQSYGFKY